MAHMLAAVVLVPLAAALARGAGPTAQYWHEVGGSASRNTPLIRGAYVATGPRGALAVAGRCCFHMWQGRRWGAAEDYTKASGIGRRGSVGYVVPSCDLAIGSDGTACVAWEGHPTTKGAVPSFYVARRLRGRWQLVGGGPVPTGPIRGRFGGAGYVALAVLPDGHPVLAYLADISGTCLKRWDGNAWVPMGDSVPRKGINQFACGVPSLRIAPDGNPVLVHVRRLKVCIKKWNGAAWTGLDGAASETVVRDGDGHPSGHGLAFDKAGNPYVAYAVGADKDWSVHMKHWTGKAWEELGGSASGTGIGDEIDVYGGVRICADAAGMPIVAWVSEPKRQPGIRAVYLKRWDGRKWRELGRGSASGGGVSGPERATQVALSLAMDSSGRPVVAWSGRMFCLRMCALAPGRKK